MRSWKKYPHQKKTSNSQESTVADKTPAKSPRPGTSAEALSDTDDSEDELDSFLESKETTGADKSYAEVEEFYQVENETGK